MTVTIIVQARMGSSRLPGKVLRPLGGRPMLEFMLRRVMRAKCGPVVVATSDLARDDPIATLARELDVPCVRGSEHDVLERFAQSAELHPSNHVVRVTADCPLADPQLIDDVVEAHVSAGADYTSNTLLRTFPDGLDVEVIRTSALIETAARAVRPTEREHVTPYIYRNPSDFRLAAHLGSLDLEDERWTVDTIEDFAFVEDVLRSFDSDPVLIPWIDVLAAVGVRRPSPDDQLVLRVARVADEVDVTRFEHAVRLGSGSFAVADPGARTWVARRHGENVAAVTVAAHKGDGCLTLSVCPEVPLDDLLRNLEVRLSADLQIERLKAERPHDADARRAFHDAGFDGRGVLTKIRINEGSR